MDQQKIIIALSVLCLGLAAAALFFRLDNLSLKEQFAKLSDERNNALAELAAVDKDRQILQARLNANVNNDEKDDDEDNEKLLKLLEQKDKDIVALKEALANEQAARRQPERDRPERGGERGDRRGGNMQERMERMREEDPERYEQIMTWRDNARKQAEEQQRKREEFLDKINTARLNDTQREIINDYRALLQTNHELALNAMSGDMESGREIWENQRAINDLSQSVRDILIEQAAGSKTAQEIKAILDITNTGPAGFGGRGGFGGGRGARR
ncbi:MAG: hypothetical protein GX945_04600 [Lentisphaerae bacterium]|jgi:hypothetical protein|nr:hypothetical protein [Lentisphaerota bacterium]